MKTVATGVNAGSTTKTALLIVSAAILLCGCGPGNGFLKGLKLPGFEPVGPVSVYNADNLFNYINGEAESYFPFGFRFLYKQSWRGESGCLLTVDAYDMTDSRGALGIYRKYSGDMDVTVSGAGDAACTDGHVLLMRRGRFFMRIMPDTALDPKARASVEDMTAMARALDGAL